MTDLLNVNGVELCVDTFGSPVDPAILLIHGASASMDHWEPAFCERLAAGPRYVIRYDHRDTGQSTSYAPGKPEYTGADLVADPIGILDALGIGKAHLVGISMGGGIAQQLAVEHPDRVASVTMIATSPGGPDLPPPTDKIRASFSEDTPPTGWSDTESALDELIKSDRLYAGSLPYDEPARRALYAKALARTINPDSGANHWTLDGGDSIRHRLREIAVPALVLHGTEDPLFPPAHGEALAREVPGARLLILPGAGHELPEPTWDVAIPEILALTARRTS
ncbi:alpha/beta hydrolase [Streptomyces sp. SID13031]|uniref:alpha/beta fold hydrolase n=1 Tax=Streptomyces sp. SID13031 TaxID=2706046 RepID=UPI0013C574A8|nr:alpha/beta hydrolase [Streptomyces sp. SID13031]NEA36429.1 alpha/beta hydrolase [Streptomyces sp. SID13031]